MSLDGGRTCECGCGTPVARRFVSGHNLRTSVRSRALPRTPQGPRTVSPARSLSMSDWVELVKFAGHTYQPVTTWQGGTRASTGDGFEQRVIQGYMSDPIVSAVEDARVDVFSEARLKFRRQIDGRPGNLFGTPALRILEEPWLGATTADLLSIMLLHADFAGNAYATLADGEVKILRPDWVDVILASRRDPQDPMLQHDATRVGYAYFPGGGRNGDMVTFPADDVAHFMRKPDPLFWWRGISWLTPVLEDLAADQGATEHKRKFFENAATSNHAVILDPAVTFDLFLKFKQDFNEEHQGLGNAWKTMFLGGGADVKAIGASFEAMQLSTTQGAGETRIAAAARVPPIIAGLSEGLQAATYSNYGMARRAFADGTLRPLWRNIAGTLATLVNVPAGAELWYDDRDISFLQEDMKDAAEIQSTEGQTIRTLADGGFKPESIVAAVTASDWTLLEHTGLPSVQVQPDEPAAAVDPEEDGNASGTD